MRNPPKMLPGTRTKTVIIGLAAVGLAVGGFQIGRRSVDVAGLSKHTAETQVDSPNHSQRHPVLSENQLGQGRIREIATVPFSELYDVLRSASREQLVEWARDLERMPRGPRQRAAVAAYYKSLVQVDHQAAIDALLQAENLNVRDVAIDALLKATPESIWGDLAEMLESLPYQGRGALRTDVIWNWSQVDPEAASKFIERHPEDDEDDSRLYSLLRNWAQIDPASARHWLEADGLRQTRNAWLAFVTTWAGVDRAAAVNYAVANARRPNFGEAINELAYNFVLTSKEDATKFLLSLPAEQAQAAMKAVAGTTSGVLLGAPEDYQRPPDEVARWMVSLPVELWSEGIGQVAQRWLKDDAAAATAWLNQLRPEPRDVAIASFCRAADFDSAAEVMTLGFTLRDPGLRDRALGEFARRRGSTRESALDAINDLPISDEHRAYLRKVMPEDANGR
jgi:hypothetical protein